MSYKLCRKTTKELRSAKGGTVKQCEQIDPALSSSQYKCARKAHGERRRNRKEIKHFKQWGGSEQCNYSVFFFCVCVFCLFFWVDWDFLEKYKLPRERIKQNIERRWGGEASQAYKGQQEGGMKFKWPYCERRAKRGMEKATHPRKRPVQILLDSVGIIALISVGPGLASESLIWHSGHHAQSLCLMKLLFYFPWMCVS